MSISSHFTDTQNAFTSSKASDSRPNSPISVPVDTLFTMQIKALLTTAQRQMQCQSILLKLFTYTEPTLGKPPFLSSKKVLSFNGVDDKAQIMVLESQSHSEENLTGTVAEQSRLDIQCESVSIGEFIVSSGFAEDVRIGSQNLKLNIEQFILRSKAQEKVRRWFGEPSLWCGICQPLQRAEHQLALFSKSRKPILVKGNKGAGKKLAALFVAGVTAKEKSSFIQLGRENKSSRVSAAELDQGLSEARGGTLYIKDTKLLDIDARDLLRRYCERAAWQTQVVIACPCIASDSEALLIWLEYHCQTLTLPSFEQRKPDLRFICIQYLNSYCRSPSLDFNDAKYAELFNEEVFQSIEQIHRIIDKIRQSQRGGCLSLNYLRELLANEVTLQGNSQGDPSFSKNTRQQDLVIPLGRLYASQFAESLNPSQEHPAILKALTYMAEHYQDSFSLQELADRAFVSPSHLSFLLKNRFGKSFKGLLIEFRIEKAQEILRELPVRQITQVCIDVGFLDLSHFEKTFKRITGMTPRKYREQHKQKLSISTH